MIKQTQISYDNMYQKYRKLKDIKYKKRKDQLYHLKSLYEKQQQRVLEAYG